MTLSWIHNPFNITRFSKPFLPVVIGDFNARSSKWWTDDKTTQEVLKIENLLSKFSLSQKINEPTHISKNFNSCINLLSTNQQNLITDSGIHPSLHSNCHDQLIYRKFNLKTFYPPPYERHIRHHKHAITDMISKAIQGFDWDKAFLDKSAEEKASTLTKNSPQHHE